MVRDDPYTPTDPWYECHDCSGRAEAPDAGTCPDCGGWVTNVAVARE